MIGWGRTFLVWLFFIQCIFHSVFASEKVGQFEIDMIRLRPTWISDEKAGASFDLSDSAAALRWRKDSELSVYMGIGSELQRNLPIYYTAENVDQFGFYEMYAEFSGLYGRVRFGLIPLHFGYDGILPEDRRYFDRAKPYTMRAIGLRDIGLSFYTENNGYYTEIIGHNGEVDTASDGRIWATGNWGYSDDRTFRLQASLQTGYVKGDVSLGNTENQLGGVINGETAKWRNGLFFANWYPRNWNVVAQWGGGEFDQANEKGRYTTTTFEFTRFFSNSFGAGFRYDEFDKNRKISNDKVTEYSVVFVTKSKDSTSEVYLLGTKVVEEGEKIANDQLRLVWLLTPYVD